MKITKTFKWEMGHRLTFHKGLCWNLHGHSYRMKVSVEGPLNKNGMVIDFYDLTQIFKKVVNEPLDHAFMCYEKDSFVSVLREWDQPMEEDDLSTLRKFKYVIVPFETTAENITKYLFKLFNKEIIKVTKGRCKVNRVKVYETESSEAVYYG